MTDPVKDHVDVVHEGKKFQCIICNKDYTNRDSLKSHIATIHEDKKPFECEVCHIRFPSKSKVKKHILMVHEKKCPYLCDHCNEGFMSKSLLIKHVQSSHNLQPLSNPGLLAKEGGHFLADLIQ